MRHGIFLTTTLVGSLLTLPVHGNAPKMLTDLLVAVLMTYIVTPLVLRRTPVAPRPVRSRLAHLREVERRVRPTVHPSSINFGLRCVT